MIARETFVCPVCLGKRKVHLYADRPDPCGACDARGEITQEIEEVAPGVFEVRDISPQGDLLEGAAT